MRSSTSLPLAHSFDVEPRGDETPRRAESLIKCQEVRLVLLKELPEASGVVKVLQVAELVDEHVSGQIAGDEEQLEIQADRLAS